jgi:hypothetical protein
MKMCLRKDGKMEERYEWFLKTLENQRDRGDIYVQDPPVAFRASSGRDMSAANSLGSNKNVVWRILAIRRWYLHQCSERTLTWIG